MKLFGFEIGNAKKDTEAEDQSANQKSFALPQKDDGAVTVAGAGYYGTYVDLDGTFRNETQLITKYRELAIRSEEHTSELQSH